MVGFYNYTVWMTYVALASGVAGIFSAFKGHPLVAVICLSVSGILDLFDGKIAKTKKDRTDDEKRYGIQIDSLTDLVCFGVLPPCIGYSLGMHHWAFIVVMIFFVVALGLIAVAIPAAPFWEGEEHFDFVFGMAPRIVAASLMAFLVGSFLNAYVMSKMKVASRGRHFSARAILSTLAGETADSLIFFPVAFGGIIAWRELLIMMCIQIILKSMYEVIILPVTIRVVKAIKKIDGSDVYDTDISYNVLKVKDI